MAKLQIPDLDAIWADPSIIERLPAQVGENIVETLELINSLVDNKAKAPPSPLDLALAHPRFQWMNAPHIRFLSDQIVNTIETKDPTIVCMPPRHCKSTSIVWACFWALVRDPEAHILYITYEAKFSASWGLKVKRLVEAYGAQYGLEIDKRKQAANDWELTAGGGMRTAGVLAGIGGKPAKILIIDDAIAGEREARSPILRQQIWDWWEMTAMQRIEEDTAVFVVGTRWHEDDFIGRLIAQSETEDGMHFNLVSMPAKAEVGEDIEPDPIGRDSGVGLWLSHFSQKYYDRREKNTSPYVWNCVYQQRPTRLGGNFVDKTWFMFYKPSELPQLEQECQSWDFSLDAKTATDSRHAGVVMGRRGNQVYVRDGYAAHAEITESMKLIAAWDKIYKRAKTKLVERATSGPAIVSTMRHRVTGIVAWPPKGRMKNSKGALLNACIPEIRAGQVWMPTDENGNKPRWVLELIDELSTFPNGVHDDFVDVFTQSMDFLLPSVREYENEVDRAIDEATGLMAESSRLPEERHRALVNGLVKLAAGDDIRPSSEFQFAANSRYHHNQPGDFPDQLRMPAVGDEEENNPKLIRMLEFLSQPVRIVR